MALQPLMMKDVLYFRALHCLPNKIVYLYLPHIQFCEKKQTKKHVLIILYSIQHGIDHHPYIYSIHCTLFFPFVESPSGFSEGHVRVTLKMNVLTRWTNLEATILCTTLLP